MCIYCEKMVRAAKDFLQAKDAVASNGRKDAALIAAKERAIDALAEAVLAAEGWPPQMRTLASRARDRPVIEQVTGGQVVIRRVEPRVERCMPGGETG